MPPVNGRGPLTRSGPQHGHNREPTGGSDKLAVLASSFNEMAASLETAERRRREIFSDVAHELRTPLATI